MEKSVEGLPTETTRGWLL